MAKSKTDDIVLQLLSNLAEKKKQIGDAERPSWNTNCSFGYNPDNNNRINLATVTSVNELVSMRAHLHNLFSGFLASASALGVKVEQADFKYLGYTFNQWEADIKARLNKLQIKAKQDELVELEARVNALVSPEQRREIELAKLMDELR
jgi:hypothetical protein